MWEYFYISWIVGLVMWGVFEQDTGIIQAPVEQTAKQKRKVIYQRILIFMLCPFMIIPWTIMWVVEQRYK